VKIRLKPSSFCIRFSEEDLTILKDRGLLEEQFPLAGDFLLKVSIFIHGGDNLISQKADNTLFVEIPEKAFRHWLLDPAILGLRSIHPIKPGKNYEFVIERDVHDGKQRKTKSPDHAYIVVS
jgi:hypothetical protein